MIGRLVEHEKVNRFQEQSYHRQPTAFSSTQHLHLLVRCLSTKHKCAQYRLYLQSDVAGGHPVDGIEDREFAIEHLRLILSEITYLHLMTYFECTTKRYFPHDTLHEC